MKKGSHLTKPRRSAVQYSEKIAASICQQLADGKSLLSICKAAGMPDAMTVLAWARRDADFEARYLEAREVQAELLAREIIELSDNCRLGKRTKVTGKRKIFHCSKCEGELKWKHFKDQEPGFYHVPENTPLCEGGAAIKKVLTDTEVVTGDMVERSKLQIEARKWYASKLYPKRWGDHIEVEHSGVLGISAAEAIRSVRAKRRLEVVSEPAPDGAICIRPEVVKDGA